MLAAWPTNLVERSQRAVGQADVCYVVTLLLLLLVSLILLKGSGAGGQDQPRPSYGGSNMVRIQRESELRNYAVKLMKLPSRA